MDIYSIYPDIERYKGDIEGVKLISYIVKKEYGSINEVDKMDIDQLYEAYAALLIIDKEVNRT